MLGSILAAPVVPFRPASEQDFRDYARALAWVLDEPPAIGERLLACAYGYDDVDDLHAILATPGEAGPYNYDLDREGSDRSSRCGVDALNRDLWLLYLVTLHKQATPQSLSARCLLVCDLGLFCPRMQHHEAYQYVRRALGYAGVDAASGAGYPPARPWVPTWVSAGSYLPEFSAERS